MNRQLTEIKEKVRHRWNTAANTFDQSPGHGTRSNREKEQWRSILTNAVGNDGLNILDVGTGTGFIALNLAEMGHRVTGVDFAVNMLEQAIKKAKQQNLEVNFQICDADRLPFADGSFDAVINRHLFWTMPQPEAAILEWARVLKPGGKLIIIDGDWNHYNAWKTLWKVVANLIVWLSEGVNPWSKANNLYDFEKKLPLGREKRPEADLRILNQLGLEARVISFKDPRAHGLLDNLKYGYYQRFVVTAVKPNI